MRSLAYWLTVAFVFTVPWEAAIHVAEIGQLASAMGLTAALVWVGSVVARGRLRQPDAFQKAFFLFLIWNGLTIYWSLDSGATMSGFLTYTQIFVMLLMFWDLFETAIAIEAALQAYVLGAFIAGGSIIVNFLTAAPAKFPEHQRFQGLGLETDGIALIVAIAAPAAWYLAASPPSRPRSSAVRLVNYSYIPLALFALVLTGTRGAALASIPTVVFMLWSLRRASGAKLIAALAALTIAVAMVIGFAPREPLDRIGSAWTELAGGGDLNGRTEIWAESLQVFLDRPIAGAGLGAHRAAVAARSVTKPIASRDNLPGLNAHQVAVTTGRRAHNILLSVLTETGIVGLVLFSGVILTVVARVRHLSGWQAWHWLTQLAVLAIGAMSLSLEDSKSLWLLLSLCVASGAAAEAPRTWPDTRRTAHGVFVNSEVLRQGRIRR
jgi:hypothetical protein